MLLAAGLLSRLLGLLSLLLSLLLILLTLLAGLSNLLSASLHLLGIRRVGGHSNELIIHTCMLLSADLLNVLLTILECKLVLNTLEGRNAEDISKVDNNSNILGQLLRTLLLLTKNLSLGLEVLDHRRNTLNESNLLLVDDHLSNLLSQLILVVLLVSKIRLLLRKLELLLNPSILLQISQTPRIDLVELIKQTVGLGLELLRIPVLDTELPGGNLLHQETRVRNYKISSSIDYNLTESLNSLFSSVYVHSR